MAENIENQNLDNQGSENQDKQEPKSYTQEEINAMLKDAEAKGYGKGKYDTNAKWEKDVAEREKVAKEEAAKQARFEKMSELEKAQTQAKESQEKLQALENKIALNEQKDETRKLMKDKGLPDVFLDAVLVFKDAEATLNKIAEVKELFDAEVQKAVEARVGVHIPKQNVEEEGFTANMAREALGLQKA